MKHENKSHLFHLVPTFLLVCFFFPLILDIFSFYLFVKMHGKGLDVDVSPFICVVSVFKCCLSPCALQKGSLSASRNMCHYYSTHHRVEGFLVSPTDGLISGIIVGRTKGRSLNCSTGGRGEGRAWVLNVFCKLGAFPAIQGKLKIFCAGGDPLYSKKWMHWILKGLMTPMCL